MHIAFIALGSNLEDPIAQVQRAMREIANLPQTQQIRASSLYQTAPVGYADQPPFINAVVQISTALSPQALLRALLNIEAEHQRRRLVRNGPRTLDCDILLYGDIKVDDADLHIPHPRLCQRAFVLVPLAEIAPNQMVHDKSVLTLLDAFLKTPESVEQAIIKVPEDALNQGVSKALILS
jgi:2-amino-4-hydroxy-6-hydroxymethyldihydropteridine diphosphokinase